MEQITRRPGKDGMVRVIVGDIEFEAHPSRVDDPESLRSMIAAEREFQEWGV